MSGIRQNFEEVGLRLVKVGLCPVVLLFRVELLGGLLFLELGDEMSFGCDDHSDWSNVEPSGGLFEFGHEGEDEQKFETTFTPIVISSPSAVFSNLEDDNPAFDTNASRRSKSRRQRTAKSFTEA